MREIKYLTKNENELVRLSQNKDEEALIILVERYAPIIGKMASKYYGLGYEYQDFLQVGKVAFINAIKKFDLSRGSTFYAYSMACVRNALISAYRKMVTKAGLDCLVEDIEWVEDGGFSQDCDYVDRLDSLISNRMIIEDALSENSMLSDLEKLCLKQLLMGKNCLEISKTLDLSFKQADNAISRCKRKLKRVKESI